MFTTLTMKLVIVFICFTFINVAVQARGKRLDEGIPVVEHQAYDHNISPQHGGHKKHSQIGPVYQHVPDQKQASFNGHAKHHSDRTDKRHHLSELKNPKAEHLLGADKIDYLAEKHVDIKTYRFHDSHDIPDHSIEKSKRSRNHENKQSKFQKHKKWNRNEHFKNKKRGHRRGHEKHVMSNMENHALDRFAKNRRNYMNLGDRSKVHHKETLPSNTLPEENKKAIWAKKDTKNTPNDVHRHEQIEMPRHHRWRLNWCLKKRDCPLKLKPLCGSNGRTYNNRCQLRQAACKNGGFKSITIQHRGACKNKLGNL